MEFVITAYSIAFILLALLLAKALNRYLKYSKELEGVNEKH
jgi:hypothetical protein